MSTRRLVRCELGAFNLPGKAGTECVRLIDERRGVRVSIIPADGGEISSFQVRLGGRWTEILHRANDYRSAPPDGWDGRAPLLWPAVGRSYTAGQVALWRRTGRVPAACRYQLRGKIYAMPDHGFARTLPWTLEGRGSRKNAAWAKCSLKSSAVTRRVYPFDFQLSVTYTLSDGAVRLRYEVLAGANRSAMPFAIGNHISFRLPFSGKGRFGNCTLRTPAKKELRLNYQLGLLTGRSKAVHLLRPMALADQKFLNTVLGGYERGRAWCEVADPASLTLRVSHAEKPAGGKFLAARRDILFVFWGTREHRYFCPEPWIGRPNALNTGDGCVRLQPGERFVWQVVFKPGAV